MTTAAWVGGAAILVSLAVTYGLNERSVVWRRLVGDKRKGLLVVSNRADGAPAAPTSFWAFETVHPASPVTPSWAPPPTTPGAADGGPPPLRGAAALLALRAVELAFFAALFPVDELAGNGLANDPSWAAFYTNWSWVVFGASSLLGAAASARAVAAAAAAARRRRCAAGAAPVGGAEAVDGCGAACAGPPPTPPRWGALAAAHLLCLEVAAPAAAFLTAFWWATGGADGGAAAADVMQHGAQLALLGADVLGSHAPFVSAHFLVLLAYTAVYVAFMWIYWAAAGVWIYSELDFRQGWTAALYAAMAPALAGFFFLWLGAAAARSRAAAARARRAGAAGRAGAAAPAAAAAAGAA